MSVVPERIVRLLSRPAKNLERWKSCQPF